MSPARPAALQRPSYIGRFFIGGSVVLLTLAYTFPMFWALSNSLKSYENLFSYPPTIFPQPLQWSNYSEAMTYQGFPFARFLLNTAQIALFSVTGTLVSSTLVAYSLARIRWRGRNLLLTFIILTMIIPGEVTITPRFMLFNRWGWIDTWLPLIVPNFFGSAFYIFLIRQYMMTIPIAMDESAIIDGANRLQTLVYVLLPQCRVILISVVVLALQDEWNAYLEPLIFINNMQLVPASVGLSYYSGMYQTQWHLVFAASTIVSAPIILLFILAQRYFVQGIVVTGVKG
ncbi:MAG: carbohydrate ABC transporter permease [Bacillota bacterium]|nr:carbohydrate ABC transporter permease [Bacillota bacterium]